jgi:hypothetical protein
MCRSSDAECRAKLRGCSTAADCCVVIDRCINQALVVRATDKATVASLVSQPDPGGCTFCLLPAVQVSCVSGQCAGTIIGPSDSDGGVDAAVYTALTTDHCGTIPGVAPQSALVSGLRLDAILGCGPQ